MICPSCRAEVPGSPKFCHKCGAPFPAAAAAPPPAAEGPTKTCPQCGTLNPASAKFCKKDGYKFDAAPAAPSQATIPGSVACPACGTLNPPNAKFCKKDGTALAGVAPAVPQPLTLAPSPPRSEPPPPPPPVAPPAPAATAAPRVQAPQPPAQPRVQAPPQPEARPRAEPAPGAPAAPAKKHRPGRLVAIVLGLLVVAAAVAGGLYWKGIIGDRQGSVAETITAAAHAAGFDAVTVTVSKDWVANITGAVVGQVKKDELLALVHQNSNIRNVTDTLTVHPGPDELEQQLGDALAARGLTAVKATVGADLVATLTGTVDDPAVVTQAMDAARNVAGLKDVQSAIKLSVAARQAALNAALAQGGYDKVTAQVVDENTVNVSGDVYSKEDKDKLTQLVMTTAGVPTVNDTTRILARPPVVTAASVEAEINKALQKAHLGTIAAVVDDGMNATLVGNVTRAADRDRAVRIAKGVPAVKSVRTEIEVAGAAPAPAPPSPAVQQTLAVNAIKGQWVGRVDTGLFGYAFTLTITGGAIGQQVGTSIYGSGAKGMCGGTLTLTEINPSQQFVFTDTLERTSLMCPGGGTVKMQLAGDGKALFEWYRPRNPTKRYGKGAGERR